MTLDRRGRARGRWLAAAAALGLAVTVIGGYLVMRVPAETLSGDTPVAVELPTPRLRGRPPSFQDTPAPVEPSVEASGPGRHFAFYQGRSGRLAEGLTPLTEDPVTRLGAPGQDPTLEVWVPSVRVLAAGTRVHARLHDAGVGGALVVGSARIGFSANPRELPPTTLAMTRPPPAAQEKAGTLDFEYHFVAPEDVPNEAGRRTRPPRFFRYQVAIAGTRGGVAFERSTGGFFYVHDPGAQLDAASAVVAPVGGDLQLSVTAQVKRAGTYYVYAELWGGKDQQGQATGVRPIAFARDRLTGVAAGPLPIQLRFGGRIIHDAGVDGPYIVRNLRLQQVDTHPAHEADPIRTLPPTQPFAASSFASSFQ